MQKRVSIVPSLGLILVLIGSQGSLWAQDPPETKEPADKSAQAAPDNTAKNQRDRSKSEVTADQQKENKSDRELARQIRRVLVEDKSLSTYAHNIKVIAQNGQVTLKGPVRSDEEKQTVEAKAAQVAGGADRIKSEIEVAPNK
jgi:hyperosmotically inducible periplasmic protein